MNREQMIAWLTLEGWEYWWIGRDGGLTEADGLIRDHKTLVWAIDRYEVFIAHPPKAAERRPMSRLMTADIAVMVAYIQELGL